MLVRHLIALSLPLALIAPIAQAESRHESLSGSSLVVETPCARSVTIQPDAAPDQITLDATAENPEEVSQLDFTNTDSVRLTVEKSCWQPNFGVGFRPTLLVTLHVPANIAVNVDESGPSDYHIGDVGGPLTLDLSGPVHVIAGRVTELQADVSGPGEVRVAATHGPVHTDLSGPGTIDIGTVSAPDANLEISGVGGVQISGGSIGNLHVDSSGTASVSISATVNNANVELSGVGNVALSRVTGTLTKDVSGVGEVSVSGR